MNDIVPAAGHAVEERLLRRPLTLKSLLRQFAILELVVYPKQSHSSLPQEK